MEATLAVPEQLSCPRLSPSLLSGMLLPLHDGNPIFLRPLRRGNARTHAYAHATAVYYEIIKLDAAPSLVLLTLRKLNSTTQGGLPNHIGE